MIRNGQFEGFVWSIGEEGSDPVVAGSSSSAATWGELFGIRDGQRKLVATATTLLLPWRLITSRAARARGRENIVNI
jgi:hypothetical protein